MDDSASQLLPRLAAHTAALVSTTAAVLLASTLVLSANGMTAAWYLAMAYLLVSVPAAVLELAGRHAVTPAAVGRWAWRAAIGAGLIAVAAPLLSDVLRAQTSATVAGWAAAVACSWVAAALRGRARALARVRLVVVATAARHFTAFFLTLWLGSLWGSSGVALALMSACFVELAVLARASVFQPLPHSTVQLDATLPVLLAVTWAFPIVDVLLAVHVLASPHGYALAASLPRAAAVVVGVLFAAPATAAFSHPTLAAAAQRRSGQRALVPSVVAATLFSIPSLTASWQHWQTQLLLAVSAVCAVQLLLLATWLFTHAPRAVLLSGFVLLTGAAVMVALAPQAASTLALLSVATMAAGLAALVFAARVVQKLADRPRLVKASELAARDETLVCSVVLPAYNPGPRVIDTVRGVHAALAGLHHEVIVVDDGSTDGSCDFDPAVEGVVLIRKPNGGKGTALSQGAAVSRGEWTVFLDSDGDIDPTHVREYLDRAVLEGWDAVVGSKRADGAHVDVSKLRRLTSWGFQTLVRVALRTSVRDTQVGCKCIRTGLLHEVIVDMTERGFLFDLELLAHFSARGAKVAESPVRIESRLSSTIKTSTVLVMLRGTLQLALSRRPVSRLRPPRAVLG